MFKKQLNYIGLREFEYEIIDTSNYSDKYFNFIEIPEVFTGGKNLIRLRPKTDNLIVGTPLYIEIIDANGKTVYHEILNYIGSDKSRAISVFIYPDTAPGTANIYVSAKTRYTDSGVLSTFVDDPKRANLLWHREILISPISRNKSEILFEREPNVLVSERVVRYHEPDTASLTGVAGYTRLGKVTASSAAPGSVEMISNISSNDAISNTKYSNVIHESQYDTSRKLNIQTIPTASNSGGGIYDTDNSDGGVSGRYLSLRPENRNVIFAKGFQFTKDMLGGTIYVANANVGSFLPNDMTNPATFNPVQTIFSSSITRVINSSSIEVYDPFIYNVNYTSSAGVQKNISISRFAASSNFTCSYTKADWLAAETLSSKSYAECIFTNIAPMSGDIFKIKTYYKPMGMFGDFIDNGESIVSEYNVLRNINRLTQSISEGIVELELSAVHADNYSSYFTSSIHNVTDTGTGTYVSMSFRNADILSGMQLKMSGSGTFNANSYYRFNTVVRLQPSLRSNTHYAIAFNAHCLTNSVATSTFYPNPRVDVYLEKALVLGTAPKISVDYVNGNTNTLDRLDILADNLTYVGSLEGSDGTRFDEVQMNFLALEDCRCRPVFIIRSGTWTFGEVKLNALRENGFSPNYIRLLSYIPPTASDTELIFKFQYFNYDGRQAATETLVYGVRFDGNSFGTFGATVTGTTEVEGEFDFHGIIIASKPVVGFTMIREAIAIAAGIGGGP